jgi:nitroreductase
MMNPGAAQRAVSVSEALQTRSSCRAFLPDAVPLATVRAIVDAARQSPSGGNLQPWQVYVLAGGAMARFRALLAPKLLAMPGGEPPEYPVYPSNLHEPYRSRRFKCGEDLYATLGIARADRPARLRQFARNYDFFGAPVGLFFVIDRRMGPPQWADVGMYMQSVMLMAREHGLHTCPQECWSAWPRTIAEFLELPPESMLFCGMALGYRDETAPINTLRTDRAPLAECCTFVGES